MEKTLAQLFNEANEISMEVIKLHGEITPEMEKAIDELQFETAEKVDNYDWQMDTLKHNAEIIKTRGNGLLKIGRTMENIIERIRDRMKFLMVEGQKPELYGNDCYFKLIVSVKKPTAKYDEALIPAHFFDEQTVYVLNKDRLHDALAAGESVPGVSFESSETISLRRYDNTKTVANPKQKKIAKGKAIDNIESENDKKHVAETANPIF